MERPAEFAGKATLTEKEAAEYARRTVEERNADTRHDTTPRKTVNGTGGNRGRRARLQRFLVGLRHESRRRPRTSLIVDPPDGKIPALTPEGAEATRGRATRPRAHRRRPGGSRRRRALHPGLQLRAADGPRRLQQQRADLPDTRPRRDSQRDDPRRAHHPAGRPSAPAADVRQWIGRLARPLGRRHAGRRDDELLRTRRASAGSTPNLHLTERFTRVDADTLLYEFTVDDPTTWTKPWTAVPMATTDEPIYEYACHEGNYGMFGILSGARAVDKKAAAKSSSK